MSEDEIPNFILVEDNEDHAILVKKTILAERISNPLKVFVDAESALEYLKTISSSVPYIIFLDINLPGMSGLDLLRELKTDPQFKAIPVIMLSTSEAESDRIKAYEFLANSYLTKPIDFEKFRQMIKDMGLYWGVWNKPSVSI